VKLCRGNRRKTCNWSWGRIRLNRVRPGRKPSKQTRREGVAGVADGPTSIEIWRGVELLNELMKAQYRTLSLEKGEMMIEGN